MKTLIIIATLFISQSLFAQHWEIEFDTCISRFNDGKYASAASCLEELIPKAEKKIKGKDELYQMSNLLGIARMRDGRPQKAYGPLVKVARHYSESDSKKHSNYSTACVMLGQLYFKDKNYEESIKYFEEALGSFELRGEQSSRDYQTVNDNLIKALISQGEVVQADLKYVQLSEIVKNKSGVNSPEYLQLEFDRGYLKYMIKDYSAALRLYTNVLSSNTVLDEKLINLRFECLKNLALVEMLLEKYPESESHYRELISFCNVSFGQESFHYSSALNNIGVLYENLREYDKAETYMLETLKLRKEVMSQRPQEYAHTMKNLVNLYKKMGDYAKAESYCSDLISLNNQLYGPGHKLTVGANIQLAAIFRIQGRYAQAERLLIESKRTLEKTVGKSDLDFGACLNHLALLYDDMGAFEQAEKYYILDLQLIEKQLGNSHRNYATTLSNLGILYTHTGNYGLAEPTLKKVLALRELTIGKKHYLYAQSLNNLAVLQHKVRRFDKAEIMFKNALIIQKEQLGIDHPEYSGTLNNLASLKHDMAIQDKGAETNEKHLLECKELYQEAKDITQKSLGTEHPQYLQTLNNLAQIESELGNISVAESLLNSYLQTLSLTFGKDHPFYASGVTNLANLYENAGQYDKALDMHISAVSRKKKNLGSSHPSYAQSIHALARTYTVLGDFSKAETHWAELFRITDNQLRNYFPSMSEKEKRLFYNDLREETDQFYSYVLLRCKDNPALLGNMYDYQLTTKAMLLNNTNKMKHVILGSGDPELVALYESWIDHKEKLSKLFQLGYSEISDKDAKVDSLVAAVNNLEKELSLSSEEFDNHRREKDVTWKSIRSKLKDGEAVIEIIKSQPFRFDSGGVYSNSSQYVGLLITNDSKVPTLVEFVNGKALEERYFNYYYNSVVHKVEDQHSYELFWKPIADHLDGIETLYLSPDGVFNEISFNSLKNPETGDFVIDEVEVRNVTVTKDILAKKRKLKGKPSAVLLGNPAFKVKDPNDMYRELVLDRLLGTEHEVQKISQIIPEDWSTKILLDKDADKQHLSSISSPRVLHLATHGYYRNKQVANAGTNEDAYDSPMLNSGIVLADQILTAYEAQNLRLDNTELVVLSACETGKGQTEHGDGIYGLKRAFIVSGAEYVMLSLWKVSDQTTEELMTAFYQEWFKTDSKQDAFKNAQKMIRDKYHEPYYWAGFVLVGP